MTAGNRPLRVAQVICTDAFAGAERYVATLSRTLADENCQVVVVGGSPVRMPVELAGSGVDWRPGPNVTTAAFNLARAGRFDVVHAHMTAAELAVCLAWPSFRAPIVCTRHFAEPRGSSAPARLLGRALTRVMARQLAISDFVAGRTEGSSVVIRPGVADVADNVLLAPANRDRVVLVAQRLESEKRTDVALRAWAASGLAGSGWRLQIAGAGARREALVLLADELGVTASTDFLGARGDVDALMRRASIFLASRPDEPFGLSVVEAMAAGLPVVAAAGGGHDETAGRADDAALFDADDPAAGGRLLAEIAQDRERAERYGRQLLDIQRSEFTLERQARQTLDQYRLLLRK